MGYKCNECGNTETFIETRNYEAYGWERNSVDNEGDYIDTIEEEESDRTEGDCDDRECGVCNSSDVEWYEDEKIIPVISDWKTRCKR